MSWVFYQNCQPHQALQKSTHAQGWDMRFEARFQCRQLLVSDNALRQKACALIASGHNASVHFGTSSAPMNGYSLYRHHLLLGELLLLCEPSSPDDSAFALALYNRSILPLLQSTQQDATERTKRIVQLTALGFTTHEIANALFLSNQGVNYHLELAKKHLGANNKSALVFQAMQQGWVA